MHWRTLLLTIALLLAAEPSYSQNWMQRYLSERKAKDEAKKAAQQAEDSPAQEIRRAEPVDTPTVTPEIPSESAGEPAVPVRRAEVADPETPANGETVRRAEPVTATPAPPAPSTAATLAPA